MIIPCLVPLRLLHININLYFYDGMVCSTPDKGAGRTQRRRGGVPCGPFPSMSNPLTRAKSFSNVDIARAFSSLPRVAVKADKRALKNVLFFPSGRARASAPAPRLVLLTVLPDNFFTVLVINPCLSCRCFVTFLLPFRLCATEIAVLCDSFAFMPS